MILFLTSLSLSQKKGSVGFNVGYTRVNKKISFPLRDEEIKEDGETYLTSAVLGLQDQAMKIWASSGKLIGDIPSGNSTGGMTRKPI